jgi:hypothetical protein
MNQEVKTPQIEKLNLINIFEVQQIKKLLKDKPDLLVLFEMMLIICNTTVNKMD